MGVSVIVDYGNSVVVTRGLIRRKRGIATITQDKNYITPLTARVFSATGINPIWIGAVMAIALLSVFLITRSVFTDGLQSSPGDFRMTLIHIAMFGYAPTAYVYLIASSAKTARAIAPFAGASTQEIIHLAGKYRWWTVMLSGTLGLFINAYVTEMTTVGSDPWVWQNISFDTKWMRVVGPFFSYWVGCALFVLVMESSRLSKISDSIDQLDPLFLEPYQPLVRQGLANALLVVGMGTILSFFHIEPDFSIFIVATISLFSIYAWIGLMLPLRGIRKKIKFAKSQELISCDEMLTDSVRQFKSGATVERTIGEIIAYRGLIENVRDWPFNSPTMARFGLYLLIPLGSMFGGALVERFLDTFFP